MSRQEQIGAGCAVLAIAIVAFLSLESWSRSDCLERLRAAEFGRIEMLGADDRAALDALRARLESGETSPEEAACVKKVGLPFN